MSNYQVFYVGSQEEVGHHAEPLRNHMDLRIASPEDVSRLAKPNDLAIFYSEHFHRYRKAWLTLHEKGCLTLYAIDGILEWRNAWENREDEPACPWTMRPVLSDKVACIGASQARVLEQWGNYGKTEIVGIPRLDSNKPSNASKENRDCFQILVTTAKWPAYTESQRQDILQSLKDLKEFFDQHSEISGRRIQVVWRIAGGLDRELQIQNHLSDLSGREIAEVLQQVDAVITTPSTVMLEGMLSDLPVSIVDYTNSPEYVPAAWSIRAKDHISDVVRQLVNPPVRRIQWQRSLLHDALQCQEDAAARLAELTRQMIQIAHDCRKAGEVVSFPARILDPPVGERHEELRGYAPYVEWMEGKQHREYAVVAAEAMRWFERLNEQIETLEKELARASDGFEQIANHPVLAPLMKVRKAAMGMGGQIAAALSSSRKMKDEMPTELQEGAKVES